MYLVKNDKKLKVNEDYKLATRETLFFNKTFTINVMYREYILIKKMLIDYIKRRKDLSKYKNVENRVAIRKQDNNQEKVFGYKIKQCDIL